MQRESVYFQEKSSGIRHGGKPTFQHCQYDSLAKFPVLDILQGHEERTEIVPQILILFILSSLSFAAQQVTLICALLIASSALNLFSFIFSTGYSAPVASY